MARLLLLGCLLTSLVTIAFGFFIGSWCFSSIYAAFLVKDTALFLMQVGISLLASAILAGFNLLSNYLKNRLRVDWTSWMMKKTLEQYSKNFLKIKRDFPEIDNPGQRIQEDLPNVIESSLELFLGFIYNFSNLVIYTVLLGLAGGTLSFVFMGCNIVIPGFFILAALGIGILSSLISNFINKPLSKSTNEETIVQSDLRAQLQKLVIFAEEIKLECGEDYFNKKLEDTVDKLNGKTTKRLAVQNGTTSFNIFYSAFQSVLSFVVAAPLYFKNLITLDVFYSSAYYFSMVSASLTWFINSFDTINKFQTSLARVERLQEALNQDMEGESKLVSTFQPDANNIELKDVSIFLPRKNTFVIKGLNASFIRGVHTMIQAPSGTGKSLLFKLIAGTWPYGEGKTVIPNSRQTLYFLPQTPTIPDDTLRNILAYPDKHCPYTDKELNRVLEILKLNKFIDKLDESGADKSLGEKQRIAFARVLLKKPDWLFLDEATASFEEDLEAEVYGCLKKYLPNTTYISIAHRSTVKRFHSNILFLNVDDQKSVKVEEQPYQKNEEQKSESFDTPSAIVSRPNHRTQRSQSMSDDFSRARLFSTDRSSARKESGPFNDSQHSTPLRSLFG